jgi:hypothetical protein
MHGMLETLLIKDINYTITLLKINKNKWVSEGMLYYPLVCDDTFNPHVIFLLT